MHPSIYTLSWSVQYVKGTLNVLTNHWHVYTMQWHGGGIIIALMMHSKVVKIGNSQGIRIPRILLEQAGLKGDVEMTVEGNKLIIQSAFAARKDWEAQFAAMAEQGDVRWVIQIECDDLFDGMRFCYRQFDGLLQGAI